MEILDLRHFASADLQAVLDEEVALWQSLLHWNYQPSAAMILHYIDARILPGFAAIERGRVRGYTYFVYEGSKGVIGALFVEDSSLTGERRAQIEAELLNHAIATLQRTPGVSRIESQLLLYPSGHLARPFFSGGFQRYQRLFLTRPVSAELPAPERPMPEGVELRPWTEDDYQPAAAIITAAYRGHIDANVNDQYRTLNGSLRFLNNIIRFPGCGSFDPQSSFVALHRPTRTRIAVLLCSRIRGDVGHVTQLCALPESRSHGVGEHLLQACCLNLASRGFTELSLTVTEQNRRAVQLYQRNGYRQIHSFDGFVWEP